MSVLDIISLIIGGGGVAAFITALAQSKKTRAEAQGEVAAHYEILVTRLEQRINTLEQRVTELERRNTLLNRATSCAYTCGAASVCPVIEYMNRKKRGDDDEEVEIDEAG